MLQIQRVRYCRGVAVHWHANMHVPAFNMHVGIVDMMNGFLKLHVDQFRVFQLARYRDVKKLDPVTVTPRLKGLGLGPGGLSRSP